MTTAISIRKNLIDLVPFAQVSVSGAGATIANLNRGTSGGTGFISLRMTVPDGATLGAVITLSVGLTDGFTFRVVNRGAVTSTTQLRVPGTYSVTLRAKNCDQPAPTTTITFSTQYQ